VRLAVRHGCLVVREVASVAPALRSAAFLCREIEDLVNLDRMGASGGGRLATLQAELTSAEHLSA
jgi:hypothetical protein